MGWIRLALFGIVVLSIAYFLTAIYSRSVRREKLEKEWDTDPAREDATLADRTEFIETGMLHYEKGLKKRLLWLIYIMPALAFLATIYFVNWY